MKVANKQAITDEEIAALMFVEEPEKELATSSQKEPAEDSPESPEDSSADSPEAAEDAYCNCKQF